MADIIVSPDELTVVVSNTVTKEQLGLGNVDNTSDVDKPISDATQVALDAIEAGTGDITFRQDTTPPTDNPGDTWYHTTTHAYYINRNNTWEELVYKNELDGVFGAVIMNGGNF